MNKRIVSLLIPLVTSFCVAQAEMISIDQFASITGRDSICKGVTNNSITGLGLFVPTKTVDEWQSFYNNPPNGVQLAFCSCSARTLNNCTISNINYGETRAGTCVAGYAGSCSYSCTAGVLAEVTNSCIRQCPASTINSCSLSTTASGGSAGACAGGYTGSCSFQCNDGTWSQVSNSCVVVTPPPPPPPPPPSVQAFNVNNSGGCSSGYCACGGYLGTKACGNFNAAWICASRGYSTLVGATTITLTSWTWVCSPDQGCWSAPPGCEVCDVVTCSH